MHKGKERKREKSAIAHPKSYLSQEIQTWLK